MWYKFAQIQFELTPELIQKMQDLNQHVPEDLEIAKQKYINNVSSLNPNEHTEELNKHWEEYNKELRKQPNLHNPNFINYQIWRNNHGNDWVEKIYLEHKGPKALMKDFEESGESEFETFKKNRLEQKARDIYNAERDLHVLKNDFGLIPEETNPLTALNEARKIWARSVAEHHKKYIPFSENTEQKAKLISGFPGGGKSKYIEPVTQSEDPIRMTNHGLLIDSDLYQPHLIGYHGGAGSPNTLIYAKSNVQPEILKTAIERKANVIIPYTGGTAESILNEAANLVLKGLKVDLVLYPTPANIAHQRSIERAKQTGNRVIAPVVSGDPIRAFAEAQAIVKNPDYENLDIFTKKLLTKLGFDSDSKRKKVSIEERKAIHNQYAPMLIFDVATI